MSYSLKLIICDLILSTISVFINEQSTLLCTTKKIKKKRKKSEKSDTFEPKCALVSWDWNYKLEVT